ncbi:endothelin-2 [Genypterus blacodes]|uniref:endothelin-2 n=1 Tax=Genypterus blacodes TaxID=154954 RepID=UPI003F7707C3
MTMAPIRIRTLAALLLLCVCLQEGWGVPLSERAEPPTHQPPQPHGLRTKRCSCNSWLDKECIYFCHLDIIWVNTPSKLLPYGMGSPLSRRRRRRSAARCECASSADRTCSGFCQESSEKPESVVVSSSSSDTNDHKLLASLRSVIRSNTETAQELLSTRTKSLHVNRLKNIRRR